MAVIMPSDPLGANLSGANLALAILGDVVLEGAIMPDWKKNDPAIHTSEMLTGRKAE